MPAVKLSAFLSFARSASLLAPSSLCVRPDLFFTHTDPLTSLPPLSIHRSSLSQREVTSFRDMACSLSHPASFESSLKSRAHSFHHAI